MQQFQVSAVKYCEDVYSLSVHLSTAFNSGLRGWFSRKVSASRVQTRIDHTRGRGGARDRERGQFIILELLGLGWWLRCRRKGFGKTEFKRMSFIQFAGTVSWGGIFNFGTTRGKRCRRQDKLKPYHSFRSQRLFKRYGGNFQLRNCQIYMNMVGFVEMSQTCINPIHCTGGEIITQELLGLKSWLRCRCKGFAAIFATQSIMQIGCLLLKPVGASMHSVTNHLFKFLKFV